MMKFITITFFISITTCFAGSGVDVGNGTSRMIQFHTSHAPAEVVLESLLDKTIKNLKLNQEESFNFAVASAECKKKVKVTSIDQGQGFKVNDKKLTFEKQYKGIINIKLDNCQKPYLLPDVISN